MRKDTISYTFNFIDNCGREYNLEDGRELDITFCQMDYDFKNMTLNQAMTTLMEFSKNHDLELGKKPRQEEEYYLSRYLDLSKAR